MVRVKSVHVGMLMASLAWGVVLADPNPQPATVSVDFAQVRIAGNEVLLDGPAEWIRDVKQTAGRFDPDLQAWIASTNLAYGQGRLVARLDRAKLPADLSLTLVYDEKPGTDFVVQLWDDEDRIVSLDLFSNIIIAGREAQTDTFIISLAEHPSASQIVIRRLSGEVRIYGFVLMPVACEVPATPCDEAELAVQLGNQLSPDNSLVREANRIADSQQKELDWKSHEVQSPVPLSAVNAVGQDALLYKDYPVFVPSADRIAGQVLFATSGTALPFISEGVRRLNLYHAEALGEVMAPDSDGVRDYLLEEGVPIGIMSIPLSVADREKFYRDHAYHLIETPVALDAIQVLVNADNPLAEITIPQLDAIFSTTLLAGETEFIRTWDGLGLYGDWAGKPIELFGGFPTYGTTRVFQNLVLQGGEYRPDLMGGEVKFGVARSVTSKRYAMGFGTLHPPPPGVKSLAIARNSGQTAYLPTASAVYGGEYPLTRYFYLYVNAPSPDRMDPVVREFVNLLFSLEGQTLIAKSGSLPLHADEVRKARHLLGL